MGSFPADLIGQTPDDVIRRSPAGVAQDIEGNLDAHNILDELSTFVQNLMGLVVFPA